MRIRRSLFNKKSPGYELNNSGDVSEIYIYDEIGWFGVDAETFARDLKSIDGDVNIRINSPGGSVFDGMAIYNAIKDFKSGKTTTIVDGLAASAASYIAIAADEVQINKGAFIMIHDAWTCMCGNADDLRKEADLLEKVDGQIAGFYARKSGKDISDIESAMADETWFTADDALDYGLVDVVLEDKKKETPDNRFDLSVFNNVPETLIRSDGRVTRTPKDFEKALRDAGLSRQEAKAVLSNGLKAIQNDDGAIDNDVWFRAKEIEFSMKGYC